MAPAQIFDLPGGVSSAEGRHFKIATMLDILLLRKDLDSVIARLETRKKPQAFLNVEAFKALDFGDNKAAVQTDLMTGENCISTLTAAWPYQVVIPAYSSRLLKFTY